MGDNVTYKQKKPIVLDKNTVAMLHIFTKKDRLEDCWMFDTDYIETLHQKSSAKEFIDQLEEEQCDLFLLELGFEALDQYIKSRTHVHTTLSKRSGAENTNDLNKELLNVKTRFEKLIESSTWTK